MAALRILVTTGLGWILLAQANGPFVEVEIGSDKGNVPQDLLALLNGGSQGVQGLDSRLTKNKEDDLDRLLAGMIGATAARPTSDNAATRQHRGARNVGQVVSQGPGYQQEVMMTPFGPMAIESGQSSFNDLFPGPLIIEDDSPLSAHDPLVMDMLQSVNNALQDTLLPSLMQGSGVKHAPNACRNDLKAHCSKSRSQIHCLGQHTEDISEACRASVGKSVPFVCSKLIDRFCDVLQNGILPCLATHLQDLEPDCKDAVIATRLAINKISTAKDAASTKQNDQHVTKMAAPIVSSAQHEASLDARLGGLPTKKDDRKLAAANAALNVSMGSASHQPMQSVENPFASVQAPQPVGFLHRHIFTILLILCVAAAYLFSMSRQAYPAVMYAVAKPYVGEGAQLLKGSRPVMELPKSLDL